MKRLLVLLLPLIFTLSSIAQGQGQGRDGTSGVAAATIRGAASNPAGVSCAPESTGAVAVRVYSGGFYVCSGGVYVAVSGGGGTTINSTNGQLPYRVNSTTFGDSGVFSNGSGLIGVNKTASLAAQLDVLSASTTRPAGRFQAASGTSSSQEMLGVYDGSGGKVWGVQTDGTFMSFGGTSSSFPALKRSGPSLQMRLADDSAFTGLRLDSFQVVNSSNQIKMEASNPSTGYYNTSDISFNWGNSTTNNATPDLSLLRGVSKVLRITDGSTNGGGLMSKPDSPTQLTADQNNYTGGTGRSLFYRLSSDASRTVTGFNPAGGTNQDGELHYFINVGANNIVLANESASSTAANRFTNVTGADITLAANEMAMLIYDNTSARWRVAKM